ncbi:MAG: hypothetical protein WD768_10615 [Phycisphaeraceae bacterium]
MTPKLSSQIESKLRGLRRAVASWLTLRGLSIVLLWLVVLLALSFAIDWWFTLEKSQRVVSMVAAVALLLYLAWRFILYPLAFHLDDDTLAVRVEERHGELHDSLISALQFARLKDLDKLGVSPQMVAAAIEQGNADADKVDFSDVLDRRAHRRHGLLALLMVLMLGGAVAGVLTNDLMRIWFDRVILFGDERYPRNTQFQLTLNDKGELILPRGDDWDAAVKVTGIVPGTVYLDIDYRAGSDLTQLMIKQTDDKSGARPGAPSRKGGAKPAQTPTAPVAATTASTADASAKPTAQADFSATVKNVIEPFRFRIRGGDNRTDWIQVALVDRPTIESFDLVLEHPQYTSRLPETVWSLRPASIAASQSGSTELLPPGSPAQREARTGSSSVYALKGSTIRFKASSNKPLVSAELRNEKGVETPLKLENVKVKGADGKERAITQFTADIGPEQITNGTYSIVLKDTDGLDSKRPTRFNVRIRPDKEPQVRAQLAGISSMIVPEARIPIATNLRDDFAITKAGIIYQWRGESDASPKGEGVVEFTEVKFNEQQAVTEKGFNYLYPWEVTPLKLTVGMHLTFLVEATDNDTIDGPKTGKSAGFFVRVVEANELRDELLRREQEQRQEFERLIKNQDDLIAESRIALTANKTESINLSPALRSQLMQVQKRQKLIGDRCLAIAKQYDQIGQEVSNNKLEADDGPVQTRLYGKVIGPLETIGNKSVNVVTAQIDKARKALDNAAREQDIQELINLQSKLALELRDVLKFMVRWSNYQQAVNDLYAILETQGKVTRETMEAHKARLERGIFGEDKPKPKNP